MVYQVINNESFVHKDISSMALHLFITQAAGKNSELRDAEYLFTAVYQTLIGNELKNEHEAYKLLVPIFHNYLSTHKYGRE